MLLGAEAVYHFYTKAISKHSVKMCRLQGESYMCQPRGADTLPGHVSWALPRGVRDDGRGG